MVQGLPGRHATPLAFVGKHQANASPRALAAAIFQDLKLDVATMRKANTPEALYAYLSQSAERAGVLVFKNGVVGNNTRRGLPVSQFRGFAIVDPYCPVVFVNGADAKAAWAFTLLHERFADTVAQLAYSGELGLRQAGRLLNTTPSNVINYHERRALPA
jgi:hypothetical protein